MSNQAPKLAEAEFFLELLEACELRGEPMTHVASQLEEASFLFSAILGALYAALDQWHRSTKNHKAYQSFKEQHPEVHSSAERGGWRHLTVHVQHLPMSTLKHEWVSQNDMNQLYVRGPKLAPLEYFPSPAGSHVLKYYVNYRGTEKPAVGFSREHLAKLRAFILGADNERAGASNRPA